MPAGMRWLMILIICVIVLAPMSMGAAGQTMSLDVIGAADGTPAVLETPTIDVSSSRLLALALIVGLGLILGRITVCGLSLGASGVLFVALVAGHLGAAVPEGAGTLGLVLFVYCVGISAGPMFFRVLGSEGRQLGLLAMIVVATGALTTLATAEVLSIPADLAGGLFAGAMTSTPALGALSDVLGTDSDVAVGFGVAYPFGIIAVVLFVQLLPRFFRGEFAVEESEGKGPPRIVRRFVQIQNPAVIGKRPSQVAALAESNCQVSRVHVLDSYRPIPSDFEFAIGQNVLMVGSASRIESAIDALGRSIPEPEFVLDTERQRRLIVATSRQLVGHALKELRLLSRFGVTVVRISRHDVEFVPSATTVIEFADALMVVGESQNLDRFEEFAGHRPASLHETDLMSLGVGVALGIVLGLIRIQFAGETIRLGLAGGPLLAGLLLGHFGRIGPAVGHFPRASRMLMTDGGLALFLADAGVRAGAGLLPVLQSQGLRMCAAAVVIAIVPLLTGFAIARFRLHMTLFATLGGICGGMTSTPGLAVITGKTDSNAPVVTYVAAYPVALVLVTVLAPLLARVLESGF